MSQWPFLSLAALATAKAGIKKALAASAVYPRGFGHAVASLLHPTRHRPTGDVDTGAYYPSGNDLGALDDLLKGGRHTWWRNLGTR